MIDGINEWKEGSDGSGLCVKEKEGRYKMDKETEEDLRWIIWIVLHEHATV
jgi:hypothetical protein